MLLKVYSCSLALNYKVIPTDSQVECLIFQLVVFFREILEVSVSKRERDTAGGKWLLETSGVILPLVLLCLSSFSTWSCHHEGLLIPAQKHGRKWPWIEPSRAVNQNSDLLLEVVLLGIWSESHKNNQHKHIFKNHFTPKGHIASLRSLTNNWLSPFKKRKKKSKQTKKLSEVIF